MEKTVICMKWGTLYDADYVNVLYNAVRANLKEPFSFLCLTDHSDGLSEGIQAFPIPDIGLTPRQWRGGGWPKLSVFTKNLYGYSGRALFIDLDMMIVGDLAPFFEYGSGLVAIDEGAWRRQPPSTMSSIFAFDLGAETGLVDRIRQDPDGMEDRYGYEQNFLHGEAQSLSYWPTSWLASFKRHLRQPVILDRVLPPKVPGPDVKVVVFHGNPRPRDLVRPGRGNRDRFPHFIGAPVEWAVAYWERYSSG